MFGRRIGFVNCKSAVEDRYTFNTFGKPEGAKGCMAPGEGYHLAIDDMAMIM